MSFYRPGNKAMSFYRPGNEAMSFYRPGNEAMFFYRPGNEAMSFYRPGNEAMFFYQPTFTSQQQECLNLTGLQTVVWWANTDLSEILGVKCQASIILDNFLPGLVQPPPMTVVESLFHCVQTNMECLLCLMYGGGANHMTITPKMAVTQGLHFTLL